MKPESSFEHDESLLSDGREATQPFSAGGGATDIFQTLASTADKDGKHATKPAPASEPLPVPAQAIVSKPAATQAEPAASSAGFTQLLRALSPDAGYQTAASPAKTSATEAAPRPGSTVSAPGIEADPIKVSAAGVSSTTPVSPAESPAASGSVTQMLRLLEGAEERAEGASSLTERVPAAAASPGAFTQPFQAHPAARQAQTEQPEVPGSGVVVGGAFAQGSATGAKAEAAAAPAPQVPGSFTQLFQALGPSAEEPQTSAQVVAATLSPAASAAPVQAPVPSTPATPRAQAPGSFTEMLSSSALLEVRGAQTQPVAADAAPVSPAPEAQPIAEATPGSFTQLFRALDAADPTPAPQPQGTASSADSFASVDPGNGRTEPPAPAAQKPPEPGSFTQLFKTLDAPSAAPSAASGAPAMTAPATASEAAPARVQTPAISGAPAAAASTPGTFTQLFRTLDAPAQSSAGPFTEPPLNPGNFEPKPVPSSPGGAAPGTFTQLFKTLDAGPETASSIPAPFTSREPFAASTGSQPVAPPPPSSPGSFTQLFSTPAPPQGMVSPPSPASSPGSFPGPFASPSAPAAPALQPPFAAPGAGSSASDLGASQMFGTYQQPPAAQFPNVVPPPSFDSGYRAGVATPQPAPSQGGAGLTQLLQTLERPVASAPSPAAQPFPQAPASQPGAFTATYGELSQGAAPVAMPSAGQTFAAPALPSQPMAVPSPTAPGGGPSEFTRILNASALREAGLRGGGTAPDAAAPAPASPAAGGASAMPAWASPAMPAAPSLPAAPAIPQVKLPEVKPPAAKAPETSAAPQTKLQQYYPLLLVMIIFLLVAILIAVIFLIKH